MRSWIHAYDSSIACNGWLESICNFCFKMGIHMIDFTTFLKVLTDNELYIIQCTFAIISVVYQVSNHSPPFALSHFRNITQQELCLAHWLWSKSIDGQFNVICISDRSMIWTWMIKNKCVYLESIQIAIPQITDIFIHLAMFRHLWCPSI